MSTPISTPSATDLQAALKKTLTSAAFSKFMMQAVQAAVAEIEAQPKALTLKVAALRNCSTYEAHGHRIFAGTSACRTRSIHMQCGFASDTIKPGIWYGSEKLTDNEGNTWQRQLSDHVQDDFGNLVAVAA